MTIDEKIAIFRKRMKLSGIDVYYIPTDDDHMSEYIADHYKCREYMSGFTGSAGQVVITDDEVGLWVDGRYFVQAEKQVEGTSVKLYKMGTQGCPTVFDYLVDHSEHKVIGFDGKVVNATFYDKLNEAIKPFDGSLKIDRDLVDTLWEDRPPMPCTPCFMLNNKATGMDASLKLNMIRNELVKKGCSAIILGTLQDIAYTLNIRGNDILYTPVTYSFMIIRQTSGILYIDCEKLNKEILNKLNELHIEVKAYDAIYEDVKTLDGLVWLDKSKLNASLVLNVKGEIYDHDSMIVMARAIKNETEIKNTLHAHVKDGIACTKFIYWLKHHKDIASLNEYSAAQKLYDLRSEMEDYIEPSFTTIAAYGPNASMMHYAPTEENHAELKEAGFLLVDSGGTYFDGTTDITRTISLGKLTELEKKYYTLVLRSHINLSMAKFLYGSTGQNLDILARGILWQNHIDYRCGTGHGVGHILSVHEGPHDIRWGKARVREVPLEKGMIVTDEPGIYLDNELGIRIENELLVRSDLINEYGEFLSFKTITMCPYDRDAIDPSLLLPEEKAWLNDYHELVYETLSPYLTDEENEWLRKETERI